jgi:hypothetical protein
MRLVVDLRTDADGRPAGSIRVDDQATAEPFGDWLDLVRVLEDCIDRIRATGGPAGDHSPHQNKEHR